MDLTDKSLNMFRNHLVEQECCEATIRAYLHAMVMLKEFCGGYVKNKTTLIAFKKNLEKRGYAPSSINAMLAAVNHFFIFYQHSTWKLQYRKMQRATFSEQDKELTEQDYKKLLQAARDSGDERVELLVLTFGCTGIRVSELQAVTVESLQKGQGVIDNKGKIRPLLMQKQLCQRLEAYCQKKGIGNGPVFATRTGKPLDRGYIWDLLKRLAVLAEVDPRKVYPHNLRHLFARTYYDNYKDLVGLAAILGHESIETTRIYTMHTSTEQQRQIERLPLLM